MGPDGVVHAVKQESETSSYKPYPCAVNTRSRFNVHRINAEKPTHSSRTVCGIVMKGKRWSLTAQRPSCPACAETPSQ